MDTVLDPFSDKIILMVPKFVDISLFQKIMQCADKIKYNFDKKHAYNLGKNARILFPELLFLYAAPHGCSQYRYLLLL